MRGGAVCVSDGVGAGDLGVGVSIWQPKLRQNFVNIVCAGRGWDCERVVWRLCDCDGDGHELMSTENWGLDVQSRVHEVSWTWSPQFDHLFSQIDTHAGLITRIHDEYCENTMNKLCVEGQRLWGNPVSVGENCRSCCRDLKNIMKVLWWNWRILLAQEIGNFLCIVYYLRAQYGAMWHAWIPALKWSRAPSTSSLWGRSLESQWCKLSDNGQQIPEEHESECCDILLVCHQGISLGQVNEIQCIFRLLRSEVRSWNSLELLFGVESLLLGCMRSQRGTWSSLELVLRVEMLMQVQKESKLELKFDHWSPIQSPEWRDCYGCTRHGTIRCRMPWRLQDTKPVSCHWKYVN